MEIRWKLFPSGKFPQACCYCGRTIPATHRRYIATYDTNPLPQATIRHMACPGKVRFNSKGKYIEYPDTVVTNV